MNLASALAETNDLLREAIEKPPAAPVPERPPRIRLSDPSELPGATFLLSVALCRRVNVLGDHFIKAGTQFYERHGRDAKITCRCGESFDLRLGQFRTCSCGRFWFCGRDEVYAAAALPPGPEHVCSPARVELSNGKTTLADYCGVCFADIQNDPKEGS